MGETYRSFLGEGHAKNASQGEFEIRNLKS